MTATSFPCASLAVAGVKCGFEAARISSWMLLPKVPAMWLGTESWDETGEARAWQRRREQAGLDGAVWLSLRDAEGPGLMVLGGGDSV